MILELDTILFNVGDISINQLVFLTLCLDNNQNTNQDVSQFLSRIDETEIQSLIDQGLMQSKQENNTTVYSPTKKLLDLVKRDKSLFDEFYELFPIYVIRPDGTKGFLRANVNKCRTEYGKIIGRSKALHEHIIKCLKYEIENKTITGKLGYMKTMWKWLTQREWELIEEQMNVEQQERNTYGTICS